MSPPPHRTQAAVRREYGRFAPTYDRVWERYLERSIGLTVDHLPLTAASRVIDVGCGTGLLLDQLGRTHPEVELVGLDLSPRMLTVARRRLAGRASLTVADAAALPLRQGGADVLVSSSVFHHLPEPALALAEWRRVLRPGGRLVVTDWCRDFAAIRLLDLVLRGVDRAHVRTWSATEIHALLLEAGFIDVEVRRHRQGWFWGMMAITAGV